MTTEIQPETGAFFGADNGTTSDAVVPASIFTSCVIDPSSFSSRTACTPGDKPSTVSGDLP